MANIHIVFYAAASVMFTIAAYPPPGRVRWEWLGALALSLTLWL